MNSTKVLIVLMVLLAVPLAVGCTGDDDGGSAVPADQLQPPPEGAGIQIAMHSSIAAGEEATYCQYFVLPEDGSFEVGRFEHGYTAGSHHFLLYKTDMTPADVADQEGTFECERAQLAYPVSYAAQAPEGDLAFPEGVALRFEPGQVLLAQTHYLNATEDRLEADVRLNLWHVEGPVTTEAGTLFFYDWAILLPPNAESTAQMHCEIPEDITLLFAMSHMHRRGIDYSASVGGGDLAEPSSLYETTAWEDVMPSVYEPGVELHAGEAIDFQCRYRNDTDQAIIEGPSARDNEMCMFVATYFPKMEPRAETCTAPGSGPIHYGTSTCNETVACIQGASDDVAAEQCAVDTCEASSLPFADMGDCIFYACGAECSGADAPPSCTGCITESCLDEYLACTTSGC